MTLRYVTSFLVFLSVTLSLSGYSQKKLSTEAGVVSFTSNAELEVIKASSKNVLGVVDPATNQFAFSILIRSFEGFNSALQREHFNENYLESERFPKATFVGKIIEQIDLSKEGTYEVRAKGDLTIHGETQSRIIKVKIIMGRETASVDSEFTVPLADHNIRIPKIVNQKIATEIQVTFKGVFNWK
jgi:YceI-like domain